MQKNNKLKVLYSALMAASGLAVASCNGGNSLSSTTPGTNASGPALAAIKSETPSLFSTSSCLTGKVNLSGSVWYASGSLDISNSCNEAVDLAKQSVSFISQDTSGKLASLSSFDNWWINGAAYKLSFSNQNGNLLTGLVSTGKATAMIEPKQTISFSGGVNLSNNFYDIATAQKTLLIGGAQPLVETGSLTVSVDTRDAACSATKCDNLNVAIKDPNGNIAQTITVPAANLNAVYTQTVTKLAVNSYTLQASSVSGVTISYLPSATLVVPANANVAASVKYAQPVVATGNATLIIPRLVSAYTDTLSVNLINTKAANEIVASYNLKQGVSQTTPALPVSDAKHAYVLQVQGIADPAQASFYGESSLPGVIIRANKTTSITAPLVKLNLKLNKVTFAVSGLESADSAAIYFQDIATANPKFAYVGYSGLKNASTSYSFESNTYLAYSLKAAAANYRTNPIVNSSVINTAKIIPLVFESALIPTPSGAVVVGWPSYLAMGAVGGPNIDPNNITSGDDGFGGEPGEPGKPVDAVFKYAGVNGNGDPGVIDPPMNALRMTNDLINVSKHNQHPSRVVIVEYTGEMSGGENFADFSNTSVGNADKQGATYIMARHFASLSADAMALAAKPVIYAGKQYYGSLIMNPDLLGAMQQNNYIGSVNAQLPSGAVNTAVDQALCLLTTSRDYVNEAAPNGNNGQSYIGKKYSGTPFQILAAMLADGYPAWSVSDGRDAFWGTAIDNKGSQVGTWFNACVIDSSYDKVKYRRPDFPAGFDGWVQANNWLIRTFAAKGSVTFGWQDNMWAVRSGYWMHKDLTANKIAAEYSGVLSEWLNTNAPSSISALTPAYAPDYFVFDRYEMDDSAAPGQATLYSARSWDNFLTAVGQVSKTFNNIPIMLWQLPGSHLPNTTEANPQLFNSTPGSYIFSTAPVYFFGDSNLKPDLSNLIMGSSASGTTANQAVGSYLLSILSPSDATDGYHCPAGACTNYQKYLRFYNGQANNYDWSKDNHKLALAAANNVFSILWGGGNTTNVIKNFSNQTDNGWLAGKIRDYYQNPTQLTQSN